MKPIYAIKPFNHNGRFYKVGQEVECKSGVRGSILRMGLASETKPTAKPAESELTEGDDEDDLEFLDDLTTDTPLTDLGLDEGVIGKLTNGGIQSVESLKSFLEDGRNLQELEGIGSAVETKILAAIDESETE